MGATTSTEGQDFVVVEKISEKEKEEKIKYKSKKDKLKVICVRTGDKYSKKYVDILFNMVSRFIKIPFDFICYTNDTEDLSMKDDSPILYKQTDKPGWWGKVDIFKEKGSCLFFDLDTIIVSDITEFAKIIMKLKEDFLMIKPWIQKGWASGVMVWNGDYEFITKEYVSNDRYEYKWDQRYITAVLRRNDISIKAVQEFIKLYSYKHHCRMNMSFPKGSQVICFHGRPNPHEVKESWVKEYWK